MKKIYSEKGQARLHSPSARADGGQALITLLIFSIVSTIIISAAVILLAVNLLATDKYQQGLNAYYIAESGAENALLRILRNPSYTGETMAVGNGTANITITGDGIKTITSTGKIGSFSRIVEVRTNFTNNILTVLSWKEIK